MSSASDPAQVRRQCASEYALCPPNDRRCIQNATHITVSPLHCNRAGFAWSGEEADLARAEAEAERANVNLREQLDRANTERQRLAEELSDARAETQEIAAELAEERTLHQQTLAEAARLRAVVERVRAVHSPEPDWEREWTDPADALAKGWPRCAGCRIEGVAYREIGDCPTLRALNEPAAGEDGTDADRH